MSNKTNKPVNAPFIAFAEWQRSSQLSTNVLVSRHKTLALRAGDLRSQHLAKVGDFSVTMLASMLLIDRMTAQLDAQQIILKGRSVWLTPDRDNSDYKVGPEDVKMGSRLRRSRKYRGLSLAHVAKALGIREFVLAAYETGKQRIPHAVIASLVELYRPTRK